MMEENHIRLTFPGMFSETLRKFGKRAAYAFVGEEPRTYERVNHDILGLIAFQEKIGILPGDKVAILSLNMPNWATAYFSITFMGAVVVQFFLIFQIQKLQMSSSIQEPKQFSYPTHYYPGLKDSDRKILKQPF